MYFNPFYEMEKMRGILDEVWNRTRGSEYSDRNLELANLYDNKDGYMLQFLAPGVKQEDTSLDYSNGILTVSLKRDIPAPDEKEGKKQLRRERLNARTARSFRLSDDSDVEHIDAKLMNGLMMIHIPKKEEAKPRKIEIKVH